MSERVAPANASGRLKTRPYLIIGFQRSGTTMTHLLLAGHPAVSVLGGEFAPAVLR